MARLARALLLAAVKFAWSRRRPVPPRRPISGRPSGTYGRRSSRHRRPITRSGAAAPSASWSGARSLRRSAVVRLRAPSRPVRGSSSPRGQPSAAPLRATARPRPRCGRVLLAWTRDHSHGHHQRRTRSAQLGPDWAADDPSAAGQHLHSEGGRSEWAVRRRRLCLPHGSADPRDVHHPRPRRVPRRSSPRRLYDHDHRPVDTPRAYGARSSLGRRAPCGRRHRPWPGACALLNVDLRRLPVPTRPSTGCIRWRRGNDDVPVLPHRVRKAGVSSSSS
jgi:hypothetical protein